MEKPWYKSYVKGVAYTLQYEKITMPQALTRSVNQFPDKTALIFIDSRISYKQLDDRVNRFANALIDLGVKPGDKVAMLMPNMPQLVAATYGAWRAGAVVIMNNPLYTDKELEYQFNNSESSFLITLDLLGPRMIALKPKTPIKHIVVAHIRDHLRFPKKQLLPIEVIKEFESKTGSQICEGYGLSETSPVATTNPFGGVTKVGSVGLPVPDTDIKIVDLIDGQKEMPVGESGEIIIKGPQVTSGYYKMPEETAIAIRDGWLYTGDIGKMDEDGYFYIVDRKKDMIIAGGYNIYPREIDEVLFEHPKILEACAVGIPDPYRGETVKAFVVLKPGETMTAEEVIKYCQEKLAKYKVPKMVEFMTSLPKSGVGKILRKELRAMEMAKGKK